MSEQIRIKRDKEVIGDDYLLRRIQGERIRKGKFTTMIDGIWCG